MTMDAPTLNATTSHPLAAPAKAAPIVRHFRQIVLWPLQLLSSSRAADHAGTSAQFERLCGTNWILVEDEFGSREQPLDERHYREFVSFLPHVQRFLYGDAPGPVRNLGYGDAPLRIYRRSDISAVRVQLRSGMVPIVCKISHIDLHFFYDVDVVIMACELEISNIPLSIAQELMYRFGRAYPPGWTDAGEAMHCPERVEWLATDGSVLATSDYENRDRYLQFVGHSRSPCFAAHWYKNPVHAQKIRCPKAQALWWCSQQAPGLFCFFFYQLYAQDGTQVLCQYQIRQ